MMYDKETEDRIQDTYKEIGEKYLEELHGLVALSNRIENKRAKEYLAHGIARRFAVLKRCTDRIFTAFPVDQRLLLDDDALHDTTIALQCFVMNISGILDNIAWVMLLEQGIDIKDSKRMKVGLFIPWSQNKFDNAFKDFINQEWVINWRDVYLKSYRDALVHRIPLYIPGCIYSETDTEKHVQIQADIDYLLFNTSAENPSVDSTFDEMLEVKKKTDERIATIDELQDQMDQLGRLTPLFTHSFEEAQGKFAVHIRVVEDFTFVREILNKFVRGFDNSQGQPPDQS